MRSHWRIYATAKTEEKALKLRPRLGESAETMRARHTNLE